MSTNDLSLKYRPKKIEDILQPAIQRAFRNAVESDRVYQFYLFSGLRGTGKTSTARWLAATLNCPESDDHNPCGECDTCRRVFDGSFTDVVEINASQHTGKDVMEERVLATMNHPPMVGDKKVYILDECHRLSDSAQNSLLKCLEEPPEHDVFIFCTTEPHKVLDTIVDRSIPFDFPPVSHEAILGRIREICEAEGIKIEEGALRSVVQEAKGSMRRAFKLLQKIGSDDISQEDADEILGRSGSAAAIKYIACIREGEMHLALQHCEELRLHGKSLEGLIRETMQVLADIVRLKVGVDESLKEAYSERELKALNNFASDMDGGRLRGLIKICEQTASSFRVPGVPETLVVTRAIIEMIAWMKRD